MIRYRTDTSVGITDNLDFRRFGIKVVTGQNIKMEGPKITVLAISAYVFVLQTPVSHVGTYSIKIRVSDGQYVNIVHNQSITLSTSSYTEKILGTDELYIKPPFVTTGLIAESIPNYPDYTGTGFKIYILDE